VVSAARDGRGVDGADKMTVTIKGNVVTFDGGAGAPGGVKDMRALRLDFAPGGTVRVSEAGADGKFDTPGGTGTGATRPGAGGTPPAGGTGTTPGAGDRAGTGAGAGRAGALTGVYVMTPDYLAISVFDGAATGPGSGTTPGGTGTSITPGSSTTTPPAGTTPGTGTTPRPGTTPGTGADRPGAGASAGAPQMRTHLSVVLRRAGGGR
jgi:hypothetical protein